MKTKPIPILVFISLICALAGFLGAQPPAHTLNDPTRPIYHLVSQDNARTLPTPTLLFIGKVGITCILSLPVTLLPKSETSPMYPAPTW